MDIFKVPVTRRKRLQKMWLVVLVCFIVQGLLFAEEVCKFAYKGKPEIFNNGTMTVPDDMVALSEYQYVPGVTDMSHDTLSRPSIMLIIDESSSMVSVSDPSNARLRVASDLLDTLLKRCPIAEVGIAAFCAILCFDSTNDPYKVIPPGEKSGYCPLLQLTKRYPPDNKTGHEILKWYLRSNQRGIIYKPLNYVGSTNITAGINASKHAFSNTTSPKKAHFNIFFSDGEANEPLGNVNGYASGEDVATTFCVYFEGHTLSDTLPIFIENVKVNGYSANNPKSDFHSIDNINYDTLMSFVMNNIIEHIVTGGTFIPIEMSVNGGISATNWNLDSTGFVFPGLFPLLDWTTDFDFEIKYQIRRISINPQTNTLDTIIKDTIHYIAFDVEIDSLQGPLPDSLWDVKCWDRTMGFYFNNVQITEIEDNMSPLEIRFTYDPGEAQYNYTNVSIEVSNTSATGRDRETITLTKNGNTFSGTFPRVVISTGTSPSPGDGTLQHYASDNIVAVFRNSESPKLPLDTFEIQAPFNFSGSVEITEAYYFDKNAEGYVDSIAVEATTNISGGFTSTMITEIVNNAFTLPVFRGFTINSSGVTAGGFFMKVAENTGHNPVTYVTTDDKIDVAGIILSTGGQITAATIDIIDKVAPIIHWEPRSALLADYQIAARTDTLGVKFSEPVRNTSATEPFYFLDIGGGSNYAVTLRPAGQPKSDSLIFEVVSVTGTMEDGDSLWIHETDRITDTPGNFQNNPQNIKRRLYIEKKYGSVAVECGYYFDNNGDGFVDSIFVKASTDIQGGFTMTMINELVTGALTLPAYRNFRVTGNGLTTGGFYITVTEGAANPTTYVTADDKLVFMQITFTTGGTVQAKTVPVYDKIAPLIHWSERSAVAIVHHDVTVNDTLFVTFTEPVTNVVAQVPFRFKSISTGTPLYTANLKAIGQPSPEQMVFEIQRPLTGIDKMQDGDSIWIFEGNRVGDACKNETGATVTNYQNNPNNTRRRLYVDRRLLPFNLIPVAVSPISKSSIINSKFEVPDHYFPILNPNDLNLTQQGGTYYGMIINVVPDDKSNVYEGFKLKGELTIIDAVGNLVIEKKEMGWDEANKRLIFVWNVKNSNGRYVGSGMYLCLIDIEEISTGPDHSGVNEVKRVMIGVK